MNEILARLGAFIEEGKAQTEGEHVAEHAITETPSPNMDIETPSLPETPKGNKTADLTRLIPKASDIPVPSGGVGILLAIALLIIFALAKAPGQNVTRLQLLWRAFLGTATLGTGDSSSQTKVLPSLPDQWSTNPAPGNAAIGNIHGGFGSQYGAGEGY